MNITKVGSLVGSFKVKKSNAKKLCILLFSKTKICGITVFGSAQTALNSH